MTRSYRSGRTQRTDKWLRVAAILFASLYFLQGLLVMQGILPQDRYAGDGVFWLLTITGILVCSHVVITRNNTNETIIVRTTLLEIIAIGYILTTTGFSSLLGVAIALFLYDGYRTYRFAGLALTASILFAGIVFDVLRAHELGLPDTSRTIVVVFSLMAICVVIGAILRVQYVKQAQLEKSRAQAELEGYRISTLMNNLTQGVISIDSHGIVRMYNAATLNLLDTNESLNGRHINDALKLFDERGKKLKAFSIIKEKMRTFTRDDMFYHYADETVRLEMTVTPIRTSKRHKQFDIDRGFMILLRDITKQKNLDEERDEFISVVSHELRTPLAIAEGTLSNIETMYDRGMDAPDRIRPALDAAHEQMVFLSRMVNDLSTLSRAERGVADEGELIDISELMSSLHKEYTPEAKKASLTLDLDMTGKPGEVFVSRLYLTELLQNLISNAIKYTKTGGVTLKTRIKANKVTISVVDTGIGISKADHEKIFGRFYRSEDYRTRETGGTGLGLYVASKLAAKLRTEITLKSRLNHGSTFEITLSLATKEEKAGK